MTWMKATWIFAGVQHGWTEQLYFQQSDSNLTTAIARVDACAELRKQMLGQEYTLKATKVKLVSSDDVTIINGGSRVSRVDRVSSYQFPGAQVDVCLMISFYDQDSRFRKTMFMGGIWDGIEVEGGKFVRTDPTFLSLFTQWRNYITTQLGVTMSTPSGPAAAGWLRMTRGLKYSVLGYESDENQYVTINVTSTPFTQPAGTQLLVRLAKMAGEKKSVLNGLVPVQVVDTNSVKTISPIACAPSPGVVGNLSLYTYSLIKAPIINPEEIRTRERGRPLLVSPGRRPNRPKT
jgi:hypothetical protein